MGRPLEEAEVRQWLQQAERIQANLDLGIHPGNSNYFPAHIVGPLARSWLAQARVIDAARQALDQWGEDGAYYELQQALAAGGETETPPEGTE